MEENSSLSSPLLPPEILLPHLIHSLPTAKEKKRKAAGLPCLAMPYHTTCLPVGHLPTSCPVPMLCPAGPCLPTYAWFTYTYLLPPTPLHTDSADHPACPWAVTLPVFPTTCLPFLSLLVTCPVAYPVPPHIHATTFPSACLPYYYLSPLPFVSLRSPPPLPVFPLPPAYHYPYYYHTYLPAHHTACMVLWDLSQPAPTTPTLTTCLPLPLPPYLYTCLPALGWWVGLVLGAGGMGRWAVGLQWLPKPTLPVKKKHQWRLACMFLAAAFCCLLPHCLPLLSLCLPLSCPCLAASLAGTSLSWLSSHLTISPSHLPPSLWILSTDSEQW